MKNHYLNVFCNVIDVTECHKLSIANKIIDLQFHIPNLKSEILQNKIELKEYANDYLDLVIIEIKKNLINIDADYEITFYHWLNKFNVSLNAIINFRLNNNELANLLNQDFSIKKTETNKDYYDSFIGVFFSFHNYFSMMYANVLIDWVNELKQGNLKKSNNLNLLNQDALINFSTHLSNFESLSYEHNFYYYYNYYLNRYINKVKIEVEQNLLILDPTKHIIYIDIVLDYLKDSGFQNANPNIINQHIVKYNLNMNEFPNFKNKEITEILKKEDYNSKLSYPELNDLREIQTSFYTYALMIETNLLIDYMNELKIKFIPQTNNSINSEKSEIKNQLTSNQIVLFLQEIGFFSHPKIESSPKVKQAKLISLLTGLNEKNIKSNIEKLDKSPNSNGVKYQKDVECIDLLFSSITL